jgi:hypothetical protein
MDSVFDLFTFEGSKITKTLEHMVRITIVDIEHPKHS